MPFPMAGLWARGLDTFWVATHRREAQGHLADARAAAARAEWRFETAAQELAEHGEAAACEWIDIAFRWFAAAQFSRKLAKGDAVLAVRGCELRYWTAARRRANAAERRHREEKIFAPVDSLCVNENTKA